MKPVIKKTLIFSGTTLFSLLLLGGVGLLLLYAYLAPKLPDIDTLKDVQLQVPLRVYAQSGELIAEFGEMKRYPLEYAQFPPQLIQAVLAAEDDRFFEHPGVDYQGILRAALHLIRTGERGQGGSTITMQVARNFFLSREKTFLRKFNEILLALKIEDDLSKEDILALYLNKIYLGKRAYGFAAAAQVYYGKPLSELSLNEIAMVAGLPKAPSRYNPIVNPERALIRRDYVLDRMHELEFISDETYRQALAIPVHARVHAQSVESEATYIAEMVRTEMLNRYGTAAYTEGYQVVTTIDASLQEAANHALRNALLAYDRRHGYRGHLGHIDLLESDVDSQSHWEALLADIPKVGNLVPALIMRVDEEQAWAFTADRQVAYLPWDHINWARRYIADNHMGPELNSADQVLQPGDIVYVAPDKPGCSWLAQVPQVSGSLVSLRPEDGASLALVGGFDYYQSKFNRVTQAKRQPGSSFKPFIYSAALDKGFTAASIINDAPVVFDAPGLEDTWRPENYSGRFYGPTRLRQALVKSRNLVSIRLLRDIGIGYAIRYATGFGIKRESLPRDLSLALGSGAITPYELASAYAVFANGGYRIEPYFIDHIIGPNGQVIEVTNPLQVCTACSTEEENAQAAGTTTDEAESPTDKDEAMVPASEAAQTAGNVTDVALTPDPAEQPPPLDPLLVNEGPQPLLPAQQVLSPQTVFLMNSMLQDVIRHGTGRGAMRIGRKDLSGKTGTTNDQHDAWFSGFNHDIVTTAWVGFDNPHPLGNKETGARAALPMWVEFMAAALQQRPEIPLEQPAGIISVRIDAKTGRPVSSGSSDAIFEYFRTDHVPSSTATYREEGRDGPSPSDITEQLF